MDFRIADTFTDSLAKLTGDEQKAVKTTAFDLQMNPAHPSLNFHKLDKAKDKNFWSVRVGSDIRLIVHKTASSFLLCYVDHHDKAYHWAERRKLETHPTTGAAQLVEIRERVQEIFVPRVVERPVVAVAKPLLFSSVTNEAMLSYGVPVEWLEDVRRANEDTLLDLAGHLPAEASEALLQLATGNMPLARPLVVPAFTVSGAISGSVGTQLAAIQYASPFDHPDAQRRFRVMSNAEELERAFAFPWEKWTTFLHPGQQQLVERDYSGPARISGSAGTGKTIVALHRAAYLARSRPETRVLLTTFSNTLASALSTKLRRLISSEPRLGERLEVHALNAIGERLFELHLGKLRLASDEVVKRIMQVALDAQPAGKFSIGFLLSEWSDLVDAWQLETWAAYRDVKRLGRKTRLSEAQRKSLWTLFEIVNAGLKAEGLITHAAMFTRLAEYLPKIKRRPFESVVVDEAQDVSVAQLRFLSALGGDSTDGLFFAGDLGQRIFQLPFSWKSLGVDVRGRSRTLYVNYRTSHQIRRQADQLLGPEVSDVDGNTEDRRGAVSVFNGPAPVIKACSSESDEIETVSAWLSERVKTDDYAVHELGIFVRSDAQLDRATAAAKRAGLAFKVLDDNVQTISGSLSISTMHRAKGLEFRAVVVMACDDEIVPLQERIETVTDDADLEEVYNTERHLLYVACTRARDQLLVTSVAPGSEFLDDLM